jgi:NTP pyrophosphatase (non-canonical NTP hydrolase)
MSIHYFDYPYDLPIDPRTVTFTTSSYILNNLGKIKQDDSNTTMDFNQYQKQAKQYAIYKDEVIYPALGLASEAGEVCGKIKKILRDKNGVYNTEEKEVVAAEIGDVLWYLSALASDLHLDLNSIAQSNLDKLADRQSRNKISGSGDNR